MSAEGSGERTQRAIGRHLVPVVEFVIEKPLPPDASDQGAEDRSHPEQRQQTLIQADAAEAGEGDQDEEAEAKSYQDLGRSQPPWQVRPMLHGGPAVRRSCRCRSARRERRRAAARSERWSGATAR